MGDIFEDKLKNSLAEMRDPKNLTDGSPKRVAEFAGKSLSEVVKSVRQRVKVIWTDALLDLMLLRRSIASDIDMVLLCTPPGYRPEHFEAAVDARKHIFTEKPIATDPVGTRRFMASVRKADQLKLSIVAGTQRRSQKEVTETVQKIRDGAIGDVSSLGAYYLSGPVMHADRRDSKWGDMEWQHRNWYSFVWICGDQLVEQHIHMIDFCNWVMDAHPVSVIASGGTAWRPREELYGNIDDHLNADFVYPNGVRLTSVCRQYPKGCYRKVGTPWSAQRGAAMAWTWGPKVWTRTYKNTSGWSTASGEMAPVLMMGWQSQKVL